MNDGCMLNSSKSLTFELSGVQQTAKPAVVRPLERRVRLDLPVPSEPMTCGGLLSLHATQHGLHFGAATRLQEHARRCAGRQRTDGPY